MRSSTDELLLSTNNNNDLLDKLYKIAFCCFKKLLMPFTIEIVGDGFVKTEVVIATMRRIQFHFKTMKTYFSRKLLFYLQSLQFIQLSQR